MSRRPARAGGALAVAAVLLAGCSSVQQEADEAAARVADDVLPAALERAVAALGSTPERAAAAEAWLAEPDPAVTASQGGSTWVVRGREGSAVRVDVYAWYESGSFFPPDQGAAVWGVACRTYDVTSGVSVTPLECPEGTPEAP